MSWGRIDDDLHDHPKFVGLSLEAIGLWTLCLSYALRRGDGRVPSGLIARFGGRPELAEELIGRGLWESSTGGWAIHDFGDYQQSRDATNKARQARWRDRQAQAETRDETPRNALVTRYAPVTVTAVTPSRARPVPVPVPVPVGDSPVEVLRTSPSESVRVRNLDHSEGPDPPTSPVIASTAAAVAEPALGRDRAVEVTAATLVARYADGCRERMLTPVHAGVVGSEGKRLLAAGVSGETLLAAIDELVANPGRPGSALRGLVNQIEARRNGHPPNGRHPPPRRNAIDQRIEEQLRRAREATT